MDSANILLIGLAVLAALALLLVAWKLLLVAWESLKFSWLVAGALFVWASEQGFLGVAAYFACWIFMFPLMLAVCLIGGALIGLGVRTLEVEERRVKPIELANTPRDAVEATRWKEEDEAYKRAKADRI